jgi:hypothetical protein
MLSCQWSSVVVLVEWSWCICGGVCKRKHHQSLGFNLKDLVVGWVYQFISSLQKLWIVKERGMKYLVLHGDTSVTGSVGWMIRKLSIRTKWINVLDSNLWQETGSPLFILTTSLKSLYEPALLAVIQIETLLFLLQV